MMVDKEIVLRGLVKELENITGKNIIGLDLIALGNDYLYFDYLLHPNNEKYLKHLDNFYFNSNPSLLLLNDLDEKIGVFNNRGKSNEPEKIIDFSSLNYFEKEIEKRNFTLDKKFNRDSVYYFNKWCEVVAQFYKLCKSFYFIKETFKNYVETSALFIYFTEDISKISHSNKESLTKTCKLFLFEEAVYIFLPKLISDIKDHATKAATSRIINRNYAHHIGSHVSHRATADKIFERLYGSYDLSKIPEGEVDTTLKSIVEMENRLTRYKDERNEFISGTDSNIHPVPVLFYKDIIQPFVENSLLMDNIAKSEGICWESEDALRNDGQVKADGICKLRMRVFYHRDVLDKIPEIDACLIKECCCKKDVPCMHKASEDSSSSDRLSLSDLGIDKNWYEMMAIYDLDGSSKLKISDETKARSVNWVCIHRLPYFKKLAGDGNGFFETIRYSLDDIEVAIPGTLGVHSVFSLLENHIRNTAKHAQGNAIGKKLPVNIILKISKREDKTGEPDPDFYNLEITSNVPTIYENEHLTKIKIALKEPVAIDTKALGFADMRINACLLAFKNINQFNLDRSMEGPHGYYPKALVKGHVTDQEKDELPRSVGFGMLLTKPCKIVFVGTEFQTLGTPAREKQGVRQFNTAEECMKALDDMPRAFQFAVVEETVFENLESNDAFLKVLPWRLLVIGNATTTKLKLNKLISLRRVTCIPDQVFLAIDETAELLKKCWNAWMKARWHTPGGKGISFFLNMYFEKNKALENRFELANNTITERSFIFNLFKLDNSDPEIFNKDEGFDVFYDRHGNLLSKISRSFSRDYSNFSWIRVDKNNPDFDLIASDKLENPTISFLKLIESGVHKILVIDERAREVGIKQRGTRYSGQKLREDSYILFAMASRVFIADSLLLNNKEVLFDKGEKEANDQGENLLQASLAKDTGLTFGGKYATRVGIESGSMLADFDTVIIHRTMLSKIINEDCFDAFEANFPNIVVTTGGGSLTYDEYIMNRIRMMPFSSLSKYLLNGEMAKNSLTNLI